MITRYQMYNLIRTRIFIIATETPTGSQSKRHIWKLECIVGLFHSILHKEHTLAYSSNTPRLKGPPWLREYGASVSLTFFVWATLVTEFILTMEWSWALFFPHNTDSQDSSVPIHIYTKFEKNQSTFKPWSIRDHGNQIGYATNLQWLNMHTPI